MRVRGGPAQNRSIHPCKPTRLSQIMKRVRGEPTQSGHMHTQMPTRPSLPVKKKKGQKKTKLNIPGRPTSSVALLPAVEKRHK